MIKTTFFLFAIIILSYAKNFELKVYPKFTEHDFEDINYYGNRVVIAGEDSYIFIRSGDKKNWDKIKVPNSEGDAKCLFKTSRNSILLAGGKQDDYYIAISYNGGLNWRIIWRDPDMTIWSFVELPNGKVIAIGDENKYAVASGDLGKWECKTRPWNNFLSKYSEEDIRVAKLMPNKQVLMVGDNALLICYDQNFEKYVFANEFFSSEISYHSLTTTPKLKICMSDEDGYIYLTGNPTKGAMVVYSDSLNRSIQDISFSNSGVGVAVGYKGMVVVSEDFGYTWKKLIPKTFERLNSVIEAEPNHFIIVGDEGTILDLYISDK